MANCMLRVNQTILGEDIYNVFYVGSGIDPLTDGQALTDLVYDALNAHLRSFLVNEWQFNGCTIRNMDIAGQPAIDFSPTSGVLVGGTSSDPLMTQAAMLIKYSSQTVAPNRGRKFIGGLGEAALTDGRFTTAAVQAGIDYIQALNTGLGVNFSSGVLIARLEGEPPVVTAANLIQTVTGSTNPSTQRRRRLSN